MPRFYKKSTKARRRPYRRRRMAARPGTRLPSPKVYPFKRTTQHVLNLGVPDNGWLTTVDNACVKTFTFSLSELDSASEFTNLFSQYLMSYAVIKMYPNCTTVLSNGFPTAASNGTLIVTCWPNRDGQPLTAAFSRSDLNQIQRKRTFMAPNYKPIIFKMPLKQLGLVYGTQVLPPSTVDYVTQRPRFISTTETNTVHYGINVHIQPVDETLPFDDTPNNKFNIMQDIYLKCRQVE